VNIGALQLESKQLGIVARLGSTPLLWELYDS